MFGVWKITNCFTKQNNCCKIQQTHTGSMSSSSRKKPQILESSSYWLKVLVFVLGLSQLQYVSAMPLLTSARQSETSSSTVPFLDVQLNENLNSFVRSSLNSHEHHHHHPQKTGIKIDENTILFENLANVNTERSKNKQPRRKQRKNQNAIAKSATANTENNNNSNKNAYFSYILDQSSHQGQGQLAKSSKRIFKADRTLQRLEKKSWKIPIKSVALYSESSKSKAKAPQKMLGELQDLFDSFKDS